MFVPTLIGVQVFTPTEADVHVSVLVPTFCQSSPKILPSTVIDPVALIAALPKNTAFPVALIEPDAEMFATPAAV